MSDFLLIFHPVSYTHLDVYKRQVQETPAQYQEAKARLAITDQMIKERLDSPETA